MNNVCKTCSSPLSKISGTCLNMSCTSNTPDPYTKTKPLTEDGYGIKRCDLCKEPISDLFEGCINPKCNKNVNGSTSYTDIKPFTPNLTLERKKTKIGKPRRIRRGHINICLIEKTNHFTGGGLND
jgi:hypothetical protein